MVHSYKPRIPPSAHVHLPARHFHFSRRYQPANQPLGRPLWIAPPPILPPTGICGERAGFVLVTDPPPRAGVKTPPLHQRRRTKRFSQVQNPSPAPATDSLSGRAWPSEWTVELRPGFNRCCGARPPQLQLTYGADMRCRPPLATLAFGRAPRCDGLGAPKPFACDRQACRAK